MNILSKEPGDGSLRVGATLVVAVALSAEIAVLHDSSVHLIQYGQKQICWKDIKIRKTTSIARAARPFSPVSHERNSS